MFSKTIMPTPAQALPGRNTPMPLSNRHFVNGNCLQPPFPVHLEKVVLALGCFWGAERKFWQQPGVFSTAVGYINGYTPNPSYEELCSGLTGHTEAVLVVFDPQLLSFEQLLKVFWESHNPTEGMRQGNDSGTQYRSGIYTFNPQQQALAEASKQHYQQRLRQAGFPAITTEILPAPPFYYAEDYHQQYLAKNPQGYCGLGGCAVSFEGITE
ncbi:MAG: peptide-methionine (S)-S-oxide reductase MsrA [Methylococcaceae bacterium]|nr:peptide-methionine (S)-S-oxide reductase MsrA [Methylococcaceae bacterium]